MPSRSDPVSLGEALERYLPHCENNPHKVAARLDAQHRDGDVRLLGGDAMMAPGANPSMLGVKAHIAPDGRAFLYVQVRKGLVGDYPIWDGETVTSLRKHHEFWAFERESFDAHLPAAPSAPIPSAPVADGPVSTEAKNLGGHPAEYEIVDLLIEALVYVGVKGQLPKTMRGAGGLHDQLKQRLGSRCPGSTRFGEIFGPIYQRIKNEQPPRHLPPIKG